MFGYIKTVTPQLRVRENDFYRAVYCGLCNTYGKRTGLASRLTLSYDFTFLLLVRMAIFKEYPHFKKRRCPVHPLHKRSVMEENEQSRYCARVAALLTYYKLWDDITDEHGMKRFRARIALPFASHMRKKALHDSSLCYIDTVIKKAIGNLAEVEKQKLSSVDTPANIFGTMLSVIMSHGLEQNSANFKVAEQVGFYIGKWIYIIDALDDYSEDIEKNRYNPFIYLYDGQELTKEYRDDISTALTATLIEAEKGFDLIEFKQVPDIINIIQNIIYLGMPSVAEKIIFHQNDKEINKHDKSL